jgi:hypothetical protein
MLGGVGGHRELGGENGVGLTCLVPNFRQRPGYERLAVIVSRERERRRGLTSLVPNFATMCPWRVGGHRELGGENGVGLTCLVPNFRQRLSSDRLAVIVSRERERRLGLTCLVPNFATMCPWRVGGHRELGGDLG